MYAKKTTVLFVDDEAMVLKGLKRMLRPQRDVWNMRFALGAEEALQQLRQDPPDVLVSDMRMPGKNGAELLDLCAKEQPSTIRMILSGHSEDENLLSSAKVAHNYLKKPCDADKLIGTITRAQHIRHYFSTSRIQETLGRMGHLPSQPRLYLRLLQNMMRPNPSLDQVASIIEQDAAMTLKLLRAANTVFTAEKQRVNTVRSAIKLLGIDVVRALILNTQLFDFDDGTLHEVIPVKDLWSYALNIAGLASRLAQYEKPLDDMGEHARVAGLLQDIGVFVLADAFPGEYAQLIERVQGTGKPLHEAEKEQFGSDHAELGGMLLTLWNLPDPVIEAVTYHHDPSLSQADEFCPLVAMHLAALSTNPSTTLAEPFLCKPDYAFLADANNTTIMDELEM